MNKREYAKNGAGKVDVFVIICFPKMPLTEAIHSIARVSSVIPAESRLWREESSPAKAGFEQVMAPGFRRGDIAEIFSLNSRVLFPK